MWRVNVEENVACTECFHHIPAGRACLSQVPQRMPEGFRRGNCENFCIECKECRARGRRPRLRPRPCFVSRLNHWYTHKARTLDPVPCGHCGEVIPAGTWTVAQEFYAWPEPGTDSESLNKLSRHGATVTGVSAGTTAKASAAGWHDLSPSTRHRFQFGGLGRGLGSRSSKMGQRLYEKEVPKAVRSLGEPAVRDFLKGKHFSHIKSVANSPGNARAPSNVILENAGVNLSRGSRNMTKAGQAAARSASRASAVRTGAKAAIKSGVKAGMVAAAAESIVAVPENMLHFNRGRKSGEQAVRDTVKSTAIAAGVGFGTAGVAKAATMAGIGLSLGPLGTPLMIAGGVVFIGSAINRIARAAERDLPLTEYRISFCKNKRCKTRYAEAITKAARETA